MNWEYIVCYFMEYADSQPLSDLLNQHWLIERVDTTNTYLVYILKRLKEK